MTNYLINVNYIRLSTTLKNTASKNCIYINVVFIVLIVTWFLVLTMELMLFEISTQRLLLKPISMDYKADIFREFTEEVTTYLYSEPSKKLQNTENFINQSLLKIAKGEELVIVILKKDSQEFLGCSGIHKINSKYPRYGIWLKKSAYKHGYATETIVALNLWAEENLNYEYLRYALDKENTSSRRVAEKIGGKIGKEYDVITVSGKVLNLVEYRISKKQNVEFC